MANRIILLEKRIYTYSYDYSYEEAAQKESWPLYKHNDNDEYDSYSDEPTVASLLDVK